MKSIVFTVLLALGLVAPAAAQLPTATIRGTVRDSGGAVVPGATVSVTNADTGFSRAAVSGGDGTYRLAALPVGRYEVRVELQGFRTAVRSGLTMTVGQEALLNFPRAGFAWDVKGDGKTAVRGGAAILYDIATFGAILSLNWPYSSTSRRTDRQSEQPGRSDSTWYPGRETRGAVSDRCGYATTMKIFSSMLVVFGLAATAMDAQSTIPAGNADNGKAIYLKAKCFSCHGTAGQGGPGGRLAPKPVPFAAFRTFVRQGKVNSPTANRNWSGMPPFSRFISDQELVDIYAYLTSIPEPPAPASIPLLSQP